MLLMVLVRSVPAGDGPVDLKETLLRFKPVLAPVTFKARVRLELERPDQPIRKYRLTLWQRDPERMRIRFEAPPTEKGKLLYRIKNQYILYLPDLEEAVELPASRMGGWSFFYAENLFPFYFQDDWVGEVTPGRGAERVVTVRRKTAAHPLASCTLAGPEQRLSRVTLLSPDGKPWRRTVIAWEEVPGKGRPRSFEVETFSPEAFRARIDIEELELKPVFPPQAFDIPRPRTEERGP